MDDASTTMSALAGGSVNHTLWDEINFYDPERGGPHEAMLPGGAPFPYNTPADDNSKLIFALGTLNIPRDMSIGFGFDSDDGTRLTVSNQTWNSVLYARNTANLSIFNDNFQYDINGFAAGEIELTAGAHKLGVLHREASGDAYIDVYQISMEAYDGQLPFPLTYRTISPTSAEIVQDIDGLQLYKRSNMLLLIR